MKRSETVAIWKGARTQSVWEYTIDCAATRINKRPDGSFFYSVRRGGKGSQKGVRPAGKRQTGVCRSPEDLTKGDLPRGMKRSGINPSAATKIQTARWGGIFIVISVLYMMDNVFLLIHVLGQST